MNISITRALGPVMIGPSSSHTAGAEKLGRVASEIVGKPFKEVTFGLHGSFAKTHKGHGTDIALVAGILGMLEYDENIPNSFEIAKERNIKFSFYKTDLGDVHPNTVKMTFITNDNERHVIIGSSTGGGRILILSIDGISANINLETTTLLINHIDKPGVIYLITGILAVYNINISSIVSSRQEKNQVACCVIETDMHISDDIVNRILQEDAVISCKAFNI